MVKRVGLLILCGILALTVSSCQHKKGWSQVDSGLPTHTVSGTEEVLEEVTERSDGQENVPISTSEIVFETESEAEPVFQTEPGTEAAVPTESAEETEETERIEECLVYPMTYSDETCSIVVVKEWFEDAWVYAAHLVFTDYSRLFTECANGSYGNGCETTSNAARRLDAVFAVNGCYSAPYLNYTVVRGGVIRNGSDRNLWLPAVYSSKNGLLLSAWETGGEPGIAGGNVSELVSDGLVTDTFCFGPPGLQNGVITDVSTTGARAQRTFIGTNGEPGDIWICVSEGRYNDGESAGLLGNQCMRFLQAKGCLFGVNLDGGGSSTMYFEGQVLNAARGNERAVVDFLCFK